MFIMLSMMTFSQATTLFISEIAEGSSNNKYIEIYNGTGADIDLSNYSLARCTNGCNTFGEFDYPDAVTFPVGTMIMDGGTYIIAHASSDPIIIAVTNQTYSSLSNGDDVYALTVAGATASNYTIIDIVGDMQGDPGSGWPVAGVNNATKDHTLIRKSSVCSGNPNELGSFGTDAGSSEWIVEGKNYWDNIALHTSSCTSTPSCDSYSTINETTCNSYSSPSGLYTWTTSGTYTDTITNSASCDSIITINLIVNLTYNETATATICNGDTYTFGSQSLTTAGQYTELFTSVTGCDSTVTLDLTTVDSYTENVTATICGTETYTLGDQTLSTQGQYIESFTSITGCDSTVTLDLTVLPSSINDFTASICNGDTYTFGSQSLTTAGQYTEIFTSSNGCDSTVNLTLNILEPTYSTYFSVLTSCS